jgi:hypothetical protein
MSHVSLFQRIVFAWKRYRLVDPAGGQLPELAPSEGDDAAAPVSEAR